MNSAIVVYVLLALYGLLTVFVLAYVRARFRLAAKVLKNLKLEWDDADSRHAGFVSNAQDRISKLSVPVGPPTRNTLVTLDTRNQVVAMGKKGFSPADIGKACSLAEGEVEVILGVARLQR